MALLITIVLSITLVDYILSTFKNILESKAGLAVCNSLTAVLTAVALYGFVMMKG